MTTHTPSIVRPLQDALAKAAAHPLQVTIAEDEFQVSAAPLHVACFAALTSAYLFSHPDEKDVIATSQAFADFINNTGIMGFTFHPGSTESDDKQTSGFWYWFAKEVIRGGNAGLATIGDAGKQLGAAIAETYGDRTVAAILTRAVH